MRTWKKWSLIILSVVTLLGILQLLVYLYVLFPWAVPWVGNIIIDNPPKPQITYGEFPISVTFEVNGDIKTIEDTLICEFDGYENLGTAGKYRVWKSRLQSGNERIPLLCVENPDLTFEISTWAGLPEYYMGDYSRRSKEECESLMINDGYLGYVEWKDGVQTGTTITKEEAWEKYRVKIIHVEYSQPIENTFK